MPVIVVNLDNIVFKMPENHFRYARFDNHGGLDRVTFKSKTQERGYLESRAQNNGCGLQWTCASRCSARQSCVMATDQESNNLDDFDIEQVINWEEHNYASKNLDIQHLPELDLPSELPITCTASVLPPGHGTQPQASRGRTMILNNQVITPHQQPQRDQSSTITRPLSQSSSSVLNPVFPRDASYMLSDIRQELTHSRPIQDAPREVQPAFPSENFDVPSISHQRPHPTSGSQVLNFIPGHEQHLGTQHVVSAPPQLGHSITRHPTLHNGMQRFSQSTLPANISNVDEPLNTDLDNEEGDGSSIDQLIEDIVDRDMPQGVGDTVVFSTHDVALGGQHQPIHHVMAPSAAHVATNLTSSNPNQIPVMARSSSSISTGSPLPVSGPVSGGNIAHAHSPLSQNPASPIIGKAPSPQMQQYKAVPMRSGRGNTKKTVNMATQQQPHSPMGVAHSPRSAPQRSPQNAPQRSPQQPSAQSPPASANPVMPQNVSSPMSQVSPMSSGGIQNMASQVIGSIGMQHSPVASPLNTPSPQSQRSSRQASPGGIGSPIAGNPVTQQDFSQSQGVPQNYMTQVNQAKVSATKVGNIQNPGNTRANVSKANASATAANQPAGPNVQNSVWSQSQFMLRKAGAASQGTTLSPGTPTQQPMQANTATLPQTTSNTAGQPVSTFDTATVLRGLTALKGTNVIPFQLKQGAGQQLQAVKLPQNAAGLDLLKQAMFVKAGQGSGTQPAGKPMTINTSQGQVICYILPKPNGSNNNNQPGTNTQGQQVKMVVLSTNNVSSGNNVLKTVNASNSNTSVLPSNVNSVFTKNTKTSSIPVQQNVSFSSTLHQSPMQAMTSVVKAVGKDNNVSLNIANPRQPVADNRQASLAHGTGASNLITQSVDTTRITFVNESTCVDHLVSAPGLSQSASSIITTHPLTSTVSTTATKTTPATSSSTTPTTTPALAGDSDDSDTPLAVLAETLRKSNVEEKKKKKKKKAEKRKKKEKSSSEKPLPAFQIFFKETQAAIRQQKPTIDFDNVSKIITQMWDNLPEDQKKVYYAKHEKAKKDHEKALEKQLKQEPSPKFRKLETSSASPLSSPKSSLPSAATPASTTSTKEPIKQESITLKIPKAVLNKPDLSTKIPKSAATGASSKTAVSGASTFSPPLKKKAKVSFNPISQRICIRDGCNMPARTTKERGTQYCSNECIVSHCKNVFQSWVTKRKEETIQVS